MGQPEVLLGSLEPGTDYNIWVQSLQGTQASETRAIHARTRECLPPPSATHRRAEVPLWFSKPSLGGFPSWWPPGPGHHLCTLPPYIWGGGWSLKPAVSTAPLVPPRHLVFSDVSHDSARVSWEGPPRPVRLFRVSYVSSEGSHSGQVRAGDVLVGPWGIRRPGC